MAGSLPNNVHSPTRSQFYSMRVFNIDLGPIWVLTFVEHWERARTRANNVTHIKSKKRVSVVSRGLSANGTLLPVLSHDPWEPWPLRAIMDRRLDELSVSRYYSLCTFSEFPLILMPIGILSKWSIGWIGSIDVVLGRQSFDFRLVTISLSFFIGTLIHTRAIQLSCTIIQMV